MSTKPASGLRSILRRLTWGLADQAVTSMISFVVGMYVARELGVVKFGAFSLAWVTYSFALNISRGLATDPLAVRFSGVRRGYWRSAVVRSSGMSVLLGAAVGVVCVVVGIMLGGTVGAAFSALGIVLPGLLLQDSWRFAFFAAGQGRRSFISDITWAVSLVPLLSIAAREPSVTRFILAWGGAAAIAALVSGIQAGIIPSPQRALAWATDHRDLGPRYLIENVSLSGAGQLRVYGVGVIAGLAAVGTVRGAELILGPFLLIMSGVGLVAVPEAVRVFRKSVNSLHRFCLLLGGAQAGAAMLWGLVLLLVLPDDVGRQLLGEVWDESSKLIIPATLGVMGASFCTGAAAGLRAMGMARRSVRAQLTAATLYVSLGLVGAGLGDALGSAWGVAIATFTGALIWWAYLTAGIAEANDVTTKQPEQVR